MTTRTDYRGLWDRLRVVYKQNGQARKVAVLDNHKDKKAYICKKLGVVSGADVNRISDDLKKARDKKPAK